MRVEKCALIASGTIYARFSGELNRAERLASFERIAEAVARTGATEIIVDMRAVTPMDCVDQYGGREWGHGKIAELLYSAGAARVLIATLPKDSLAGDFITACRTQRIRAECLAFFDILDRVA